MSNPVFAAQSHLNATPHPKPVEYEALLSKFPVSGAAHMPVWVSDAAAGPSEKTVRQSDLGGGANNRPYWANVALTKLAHRVEFILAYQKGSPLLTQIQSFDFPGGYDGTITTPFGVPFWGGNPIVGAATLTVTVDGAQVGSWSFNVTA